MQRTTFPVLVKINVGLLVLAVTGFGLPLYLWHYLKRYEREVIAESNNTNGTSHLSTINEDEECEDGSVKFLNGSKRSNGKAKGLADEQEVHLSINAITF